MFFISPYRFIVLGTLLISGSTVPALSQDLLLEGLSVDLKGVMSASRDVSGPLVALQAQVNAQQATTGTPGESPLLTPGVKEALSYSSENVDGLPIVIDDQVLLMLQPDLNRSEIDSLVSKYNLRVIEVFPGLGAINVEIDPNVFIKGGTTQKDQLNYAEDVANFFTSDPRVIAATPNVPIWSNQKVEFSNPLTPPVNYMSMADSSEREDWGVSDIEAESLWSDVRTQTGVLVGVIDVGFSLHEDLTFSGLRDDMLANDHGNHVSGIMCAKHNGLGVVGVIPECFIVPRTGNFLPIISEGEPIESFQFLFSQIIRTMDDFVLAKDEISVFNASLGYNWAANFKDLDPSDPANSGIRSAIQNQGVFLLQTLKIANDRGVLIFSAAGNDSSTGMPPRDAAWASPFNWAAKAGCQELGICNGVVVEAHDPDGRRAAFSNVNGTLSCPGVDVLSTTARLEEDGPAVSAGYGTMSGTSMASPYCAAGALLFTMVRPGYSPSEVVQCLRAGPESDSGTPMLKLSAALAACPEL